MVKDNGENLAFLLGLPRSGTTLLSVMLDRHPAIACPPEPWIMLALDALGKTSWRHPADAQILSIAVHDFCLGEGGFKAVRKFAQTIYNEKLKETKKSYFVDKTPRYYLILPFIEQIFKNAKWIWLLRNPLDVAASYRTSWGIDIPDLIKTHADDMWPVDIIVGLNNLCDFSDAHSQSVHIIKYEELVADPKTELQRLFDYLGVSYKDDLLSFNLDRSAYAKSQMGDKKILATNAPHQRSIDSWKEVFSKEELQILLDAIGSDMLRKLGYENTVDELISMDVVDRGREVADHWLGVIKTNLDRRIVDVNNPTITPHGKLQELQKNADDYRVWAERTERMLAAEKETSAQLRTWVEKAEAQVTQVQQVADEHRAWAERTEKMFAAEKETSEKLRTWTEDAEARVKQAQAAADDNRAWAERTEQMLAAEKEISEKLRTWAEDAEARVKQAQQAAEGNRAWAERTEQMLVAEKETSEKLRTWAVNAEARLAQKDEQLLHDEEQIRQLEEKIAEKDEQFRKKCEELIEVDNQFKAKCVEVVTRDQELVRICEERSGEKQKFEGELKKRDATIGQMSERLKEKDKALKEREDRISALLNSMSWKITTPLRAVFGFFKKNR